MTIAREARTVLELPSNCPPGRFYAGGHAIADFRGEARAPAAAPEDWVASTTALHGHAEMGLTRLPSGRRLREAVEEDPTSWLGEDHRARHGATTALLVKLLHAGQRLPVHVHPDDRFSRGVLGLANGKTEAWYVLDAEEGARVHLGFAEEVDEAQLSRWVADQDVEAMLDHLRTREVHAGDTVLVPAGLPHAIGSGILLVELQQPADLSLLLEWEGFDIDGRLAGHLGLGFAAALQCVDRRAVSTEQLERLVTPAGSGRRRLLPAAADPFFRLSEHTGSRDDELSAGFAVLVTTSGAGELHSAAGRVDELRRGSVHLVPHAAGPCRVVGDVHVLAARPPL